MSLLLRSVRRAVISGAVVLLACSGGGSNASDGGGPTAGPPLPAYGVQLHVGPFNVPSGTEIQHCYYFKIPDLPDKGDHEVVRFQIAYRKGSHHMNLFRTLKSVPDHDEECFTPMDFTTPANPNGVDLIVGSQNGNDFDWQLPAGVAFQIKAGTQLVLQTHYVNATTQAGDTGEVWVNLNDAQDRSSITAHVGTMFANNMQIKLPPHSPSSFTTTCGVPTAVNVIAATGHFHSRGVEFTAGACPRGTDCPADPHDMTNPLNFYDSKAWNDPPFTTLKTPIALAAGGALQYTCDFFNATDTQIVFGPHVETQEHCNLFAYFYPWEDPHARYCF